MKMDNSSGKDYEDFLEDDQQLLQALEESIREYERNQAECTLNGMSKFDCQINQPGTSKQSRGRQGGTTNTESKDDESKFCGMDQNGFDRFAGRSWIYPTNYPIRDYQFNIVECALFKNTLVSLPTGLGKTFIAAVVMYNFYRWFPEGKVLFLAPTRPLVAQQINSCYKVMGIPKQDTAEMTGQMQPNQRAVHWKKCRLFFLTPQSLMSDLLRSSCPVEQIRCVVVDEAHRATGNYAYCQVIQAILPFNKFFRVLALSATPGNDMEAVQQVVKNLLIEHVEVRDETSADTAQFTNERTVETIVVKLEGFHKYIQESFCQILGGYMDHLLKWKLIYCTPRNVSKYALMMARNKFRLNPPQGMSQSVARQIEGDFFLCMTLSHGLELLSQHGLRNLFRYLQGLVTGTNKDSNPTAKARLNCDNRLKELLDFLEQRLGDTELTEPDLNTSIGVIQTQSAPSVYSHPKMEKLRDVIINHFQTYQLKGDETRVMVFCQYRDTVVEICHLLARLKPLVKVMSFVGQSAGKMNKGLSQKKQLQIMEKFRKGGYNTLISTSIGEEGLDIGEVDLIVCYDAHASPIRLVQRMGRTGRKRQGRIVMLLTEGKENKKYLQSVCNKKSMNAGLVNSKQFLKFLYSSPRMIPSDLTPECYKMFMNVPKTNQNRDVRKMLMGNKRNSAKGSGLYKNLDLENIDLDIAPDLLPETKYLHSMEADEFLKFKFSNPSKIDYSSDLDWLLNDTETINVSRSCAAKDLQDLLEFAGRQRCDVPLTQTANLASQVCRNELWPSKKRKKGSTQSKGPQRKKKKQDNEQLEPVKKSKQRRLTNLWTGISESQEDFMSIDSKLMPPPNAVSFKKKKLKEVDLLAQEEQVEKSPCNYPFDEVEKFPEFYTIQEEEQVSEGNKVDILNEGLIMSEQMISKIKKLEDGLISCCRFSKMFRESKTASFLVKSICEEEKNKSLLPDILHLPDSGYFDDLLDPEVWKNINKSNEVTSPLVSSQKRRKVKNCSISDSHHENFVSSAVKELDYKSPESLNLEDSEFIKSDLHLNFHLAAEKKPSDVGISEDLWGNFDIGITQLLKISPDLSSEVSLDAVECKSDTDANQLSPSVLRFDMSWDKYSNCIEVTSEERRKETQKRISQEQILEVPSKKRKVQFMEEIDDLESIVPLVKDSSYEKLKERFMEEVEDPKSKMSPDKASRKITKTDPSNQLAKKGLMDMDLTDFVDEAVLKWLQSSDDGLDDISSPENIDEDQCNLSDTPVSPIISSQRNKKSLITSRSTSTPKPNKILLETKEKIKKKALNIDTSTCAVKKRVSLENESKDVFRDDSSLEDCNTLRPVKINRGKRPSLNISDTSSKKNVSLKNDSSDVFHDNSSLEDFDTSSDFKLKYSSKKNKKDRNQKKKKKTSEVVLGAGAEFIVNEADESHEYRRLSSDEENTSGLDDLDDSFVDDEETAVNDSVDIQAQYLQSVKSLANTHGKFKIKEVQNVVANIYSQPLTEEELHDSYEEDSFCVSTENEESDFGEQDTLDIIEVALKTKKKKKKKKKKEKKKKRKSSPIPQKKKSLKRICVASSSSEEETDVLKNLQPSQFLPDDRIRRLEEENPVSAAESKGDNYNTKKHSLYSNCNTDANKQHDICENVWGDDDDDCLFLTENFIASQLNKHIKSSYASKQNETSLKNKNLNDNNTSEKFLPPAASKTISGLKSNGGQTGVRKQLNFVGNNQNKNSLMTHFFSPFDKEVKSAKAVDTTGNDISTKFQGMKASGIEESSRHSFQQKFSEDLSKREGQMTVIAATRQVTAAPEIITAMKARHSMFVLVHPMKVAHYVISTRIGIIRTTLKDVCSGPKSSSLLDAAKILSVHFQSAYFLIEHKPSEFDQRGLWPPHALDLSSRLRASGVNVLFSDSKACSADLLANLCCREYSCGCRVVVPKTIKNNSAMIHFLERIPGVNIAVAFDICCRYSTIENFIKKCQTVPEIRQMLGVSREIARKIYYFLHDVVI